MVNFIPTLELDVLVLVIEYKIIKKELKEMEILQQLATEYLIPACGAALVAILGWIGKKVAAFIKTKELTNLAKTVASATEQMYKDLKGPEKLEKALEMFAELAESKGIKTSAAELHYYIESAVGEFNDVFNQTLKETEEIEKIPDGSEIIIDGGNDHVALQEEN